MTSIKVNIDGEVQEVETKPITLLCHRDNVNLNIEDADVVEINPQKTVLLADHLTQEEYDFIRNISSIQKWWKMIFTDQEMPLVINGQSLAYRHVIGLLVLTFITLYEGKRPFWRLPESYLHPSAQVGLADVLISIVKAVEENA